MKTTLRTMRWLPEDYLLVQAEARQMGIAVTSLIRQAALDFVHARRAAREAQRVPATEAVPGTMWRRFV
jgi:hypothetical protein